LQLVFFLLQLVQLLRGDAGGQALRALFVRTNQDSHMLQGTRHLAASHPLACPPPNTDGAIVTFFKTAAAGSDLFAHQLIWALNSEARPPEEAFNPEVKR
jgi:hypothetical protein